MSAVAWLAACQGLPQLSLFDPSPQAAGPGWRVVERLGEARYLAPGMAGWEEVASRQHDPRRQPDHDRDRRSPDRPSGCQPAQRRHRQPLHPARLGARRQCAPYRRLAALSHRDGAGAGFGIETPFLDLEVDEAVLDVTVGESETEVAVVSGRVRVKTLDERRQIDLRAGYTGYASLEGEALAVRRGPGQGLEPVPPIVLPALHPRSRRRRQRRARSGRHRDDGDCGVCRARPGVRRSTRAERGAAAGAGRLARRRGDARRPLLRRPSRFWPLPRRRRARGRRPMRQPSGAPQAQAPLAHAETEPAEQIRRRFDGLTEGLLDGLLPALPQGDGR